MEWDWKIHYCFVVFVSYLLQSQLTHSEITGKYFAKALKIKIIPLGRKYWVLFLSFFSRHIKHLQIKNLLQLKQYKNTNIKTFYNTIPNIHLRRIR